ncbi:MAG: hypothetical protein ACTSQQ_07355, partial [Candidatus Helarchaeota archaeon]
IHLPIFPWPPHPLPPTNPSIKGDINLDFAFPLLSTQPQETHSTDLGEKILITTIGHQPKYVLRAVNQFQCTKLVIIHNFHEAKIAPLTDTIQTSFSAPLTLHSVLNDNIETIMEYLFETIHTESEAGRKVLLNLSGGNQKLTIAIILTSYLCYNKIASLSYSPGRETPPIYLPLLAWHLPL